MNRKKRDKKDTLVERNHYSLNVSHIKKIHYSSNYLSDAMKKDQVCTFTNGFLCLPHRSFITICIPHVLVNISDALERISEQTETNNSKMATHSVHGRLKARNDVRQNNQRFQMCQFGCRRDRSCRQRHILAVLSPLNQPHDPLHKSHPFSRPKKICLLC